MEMGSGSLTESGGSSTNSSAESFNGFQFSKKICFSTTAAAGGGGASMGTPSKSSGPGSSSSSGSGKKAQDPRCQVEGCNLDLSDAKTYYSKHKVCCMHSKSSKVVVAGLDQRFCQQCSRFHLLSEFDKGKRSCRRRLAGHNERRRKSSPGSLFSSPYGGFSSSFIENGSRGGSFIVDFSAYHRLSSSERVHGNQNTATGRSFPHPWQQNNSNNPLNDLFQQGGTSFSGTAVPNGECFTGSGGTSCALSLLSNQPWGSRNQASSFAVNVLISNEGSSAAQPTASHGVIMNPCPTAPWGFSNNGSVRNSQEMLPHLDIGPISDPVDCQFSSGPELSQQSRRPYVEIEQSKVAYDDSLQHIQWSL